MQCTEKFMEIVANVLLASWLLLALLHNTDGANITQLMITREKTGDHFSLYIDSALRKCSPDFCLRLSNGTAVSKVDSCTCQCLPHLPTYREDLKICVDDIQECQPSPFSADSSSEHLLTISLPEKGETIDIRNLVALTEMSDCNTSDSKIVTENGLVDIKSGMDDIFRFYKKDGNSLLLWFGQTELRNQFLGKLVIVHLSCRNNKLSTDKDDSKRELTFCVAIKITNSPAEHVQYTNEVAFILDANVTAQTSEINHMSITEYVAITICSILIGLIYVATVFFYLHLKKKSRSIQSEGDKYKQPDNISLRTIEEGALKSNPLLSLPSNYFHNDSTQSDTNSSDNELKTDIKPYEDKSQQFTSALVHYHKQKYCMESFMPPYSFVENNQDSATNERLPEQNVSIIETLEGKEDNTDMMGAFPGNTRKKLYFNPAYLEPQLLLAPPPAAIEFLIKIREVIAAAKQKLAIKRFAPSLMNIPEEDHYISVESKKQSVTVSRQGSAISLKRENSRKKNCVGCPGCKTNNLDFLTPQPSDFPALLKCFSCISSNADSKQRSIQKWLEDVTIPREETNSLHEDAFPKCSIATKKVRSPSSLLTDKVIPEKNFLNNFSEENIYETVSSCTGNNVINCPASSTSKFCEIDNPEMKNDTLTKQMQAVIKELNKHNNNVILPLDHRKKVETSPLLEYETDSLERKRTSGLPTPKECSDNSSSEPSPCLSTVLPICEEITMRNAVFSQDVSTGEKRKKSYHPIPEEVHDYELLILKKGSVNDYSDNLPGLLQKTSNYSLVSEVYVNNGYNYGSRPSTPGSSAYSTIEKKPLRLRYEQGLETQGKLLIEVEDCADHYIPVHESDYFEPDTLERKTVTKKNEFSEKFVDSLERPTQILLRSNGSFRNDQPSANNAPEWETSNFNRVFGSLREIYEAKTKKKHEETELRSLRNSFSEGRTVQLDEKYSRRQRTKEQVIPPDLIPPLPHHMAQFCNSFEVTNQDTNRKPPIPPKIGKTRNLNNCYSNVLVESPVPGTTDKILEDYELCVVQKSKKDGNLTKLIQTESVFLEKRTNNQLILHSRIPSYQQLGIFQGKNDLKHTLEIPLRPEDSGYLSTDSNETQPRLIKYDNSDGNCAGSETDESLGDGHSESGAESVETHSVFFNRFARLPMNYRSMDSGVMGEDEGPSSSESESRSFTTIVPVTTC